MQMLPDDIDYEEYERQTNFKAKVRPASTFSTELETHFRPPPDKPDSPHMFSTKLRGLLRFRKGEVTAYAGYNKHRKSMFTAQVALDLCVQGERVLIASLEMYPEQTLARMARQASGVAGPSSEFLHLFNKWSDGRLWMFDHVGQITPTHCLGLTRYFGAEMGGKHVFIDSMMMVVASEERLDEQKKFVTDLVRLAQETGLHIHLITHCRKPDHGDESKAPGKYDLRGSAAISDQTHNIVTVWANKPKARKLEENPLDLEALSKPDALVSVEGQRNGAFEGRLKLWFDEPSFRFCDDRGTRVEPYVLASKTQRDD